MTESAPRADVRFNPPSNWPQPPPGWRPDPAWGPPPPGWMLWVPVQPEPTGDQAPNGHPGPAPLVLPPMPQPTPATGGAKGRYQALTGDYARLWEWAHQVMALEPFRVIAEANRVRAEAADRGTRAHRRPPEQAGGGKGAGPGGTRTPARGTGRAARVRA